jgi:tetratricopeptide (TPR) repeat protein
MSRVEAPGWLGIAGLLTLVAQHAPGQIPERFTNLQVLPQETSRKELVQTMRGWASALGVRCGHCHTGGNPDTLEGVDFASDAKWEKRTARQMLRMVRALEADHLQRLDTRPSTAAATAPAPVRVACVTCHRGVARPETIDAVLKRALDVDGLEAALRKYGELRAEYLGRGSYDFSERPVNRLAEQLLDEKRVPEAAALLEMGAQYNPDAAWLQHLLGEARLAAGDRSAALRSFERALALNPQNQLTRKRVEELKAEATPRP